MHKVAYIEGTDARNHIAKCECGWAASGTYRDVRHRGSFHADQDNSLEWRDPRRAAQSDKRYPIYAGWHARSDQQ